MIYIGPGEDASYEDQRKELKSWPTPKPYAKPWSAISRITRTAGQRTCAERSLSDAGLHCEGAGRLDEARQLCKEANNHSLVSQDLLLQAGLSSARRESLCA